MWIQDIDDVHHLSLDPSESPVTVRRVLRELRDTLSQTVEPSRYIFVFQCMHKCCVSHTLPPWRPRLRYGDRNQHHFTERSLLSSKKSEALLLNIDTVGEGVANSLEPSGVGTVPSIISGIEELGFSPHDFHPAEILREDMHRIKDSVLLIRIRAIRTEKTTKKVEFNYIVDPRFQVECCLQ
ncbi:MAG: hypothetical protein WAN20_19070 [Pseudonocardiaceae bacterium]